MTFKDFAKGALLLPATVFNGILDLLLGSYQRDEDGKIKLDRSNKELTNRGLLGAILDLVKDIARGVSNFLHNHEDAIATAFWVSAALAGAAALTVFLWPAALAAVTTFTVAGYSIAGVVGTGFAAQVGAVAALTAVASSAAVYTVATIANTINWFIACCCKPKSGSDDENGLESEIEYDDEEADSSSSKMRGLGSRSQRELSSSNDSAPLHSRNPLDDRKSSKVELSDEKAAPRYASGASLS
jgi:hypothetical protein